MFVVVLKLTNKQYDNIMSGIDMIKVLALMDISIWRFNINIRDMMHTAKARINDIFAPFKP